MTRQPQQHSDTDLIVMVVVGMLVLGSVGGFAAVAWRNVVAWCLEHGLLLPSSVSPMLSVPGTEGAGLDLSRLAVLAAVLIFVAALAARGVRRALRTEGELR